MEHSYQRHVVSQMESTYLYVVQETNQVIHVHIVVLEVQLMEYAVAFRINNHVLRILTKPIIKLILKCVALDNVYRIQIKYQLYQDCVVLILLYVVYQMHLLVNKTSNAALGNV